MTSLRVGWQRWGLTMTEFEPVAEAYRRVPGVRLVARYAAGDGALPEEIEIEWETAHPTVDELAVLVDACGAVARGRWRHLDPEDVTAR